MKSQHAVSWTIGGRGSYLDGLSFAVKSRGELEGRRGISLGLDRGDGEHVRARGPGAPEKGTSSTRVAVCNGDDYSLVDKARRDLGPGPSGPTSWAPDACGDDINLLLESATQLWNFGSGGVTYTISICPEKGLDECRLVRSVLLSVNNLTSSSNIGQNTHHLSKDLV